MQVLAALCFLVLAHLPPLRGEVVKLFKNAPYCLDFFYKGKAPRWNVPKNHIVYICQRFNNNYHFATLYDTANRIPIYSAYRFQTGGGGGGRKTYWFIEPQLVDRSWNKDMEDERMLKNTDNVDFGESQALNDDYKDSGYTRGHLNPNGHHSAADSRQATFTLTNVVPQNPDLNQRAWNDYEMELQRELSECSQAYVLVGAIPSADKWLNERVNIPDRIWNAYCCLDKNSRPIRSGGAIARNNDQARVRKHNLLDLELLLGQYTNSEAGQLFDNNCGA